jgi:predicted DNA-binding transcriptional regulator
MQYRIPLGVKEIMAELELPDSRQVYQQVHKICMRGVKAREIERTTRGAFVLATTQEDGRYS